MCCVMPYSDAIYRKVAIASLSSMKLQRDEYKMELLGVSVCFSMMSAKVLFVEVPFWNIWNSKTLTNSATGKLVHSHARMHLVLHI